MRDLVAAFRVFHGMSREDAKKTATAMVMVTEELFKRGEQIDLGFVQLKPSPVKPRVVNSPLTGERHFIGESVKWTFSWSKKWLAKAQPFWSKYF